MTYSRQQWDRAVGLYIRYECCAAAAIHELGYPSKEALRMWDRERLECVLSRCYRPVWREFSFRKSGRF